MKKQNALVRASKKRAAARKKAQNKLVQVEIALGDVFGTTAVNIKERLHDQAVKLAQPVDGMVTSRIRESHLVQVQITLGPRIDAPTAEGLKAQLQREAVKLAQPVNGEVASGIVVEDQTPTIPPPPKR